MIPVAYFNYFPSGLSVGFKDLSTGNPTAWTWDFGDGSTSSEQNPTHVYTQVGYYVVKLIASNGDESSGEISQNIGIGYNGVALPMNLVNLVKTYIPSGVTINPDSIDVLIKKWQIYFQPLVTPVVAESNTYNELAYSPLVNTLISKLVAIDLIEESISQFILNLGGGTGAKGQEKKHVVTGPAEVEWFSNNDIYKTISSKGGTLDMMKLQACVLSTKLRIQLSFCDPLKQNTIVPQNYRPRPKLHH